MAFIIKYTWILDLLLLSVIFYTSEAVYQKTNNWKSFQAAHILNPAVASDANFGSWTPREWKRWFDRRKPLLDSVKTPRVNPNALRHYSQMKHIDAVLVTNPREVLEAFSGPLTPYGTKNQAAVWSNKPFKIFVIQRAGKAFHVYDCDKAYVAVRLFNGEPAHLQDYYPEIIPNPLGGNLRYPVSRNCKRVRQFMPVRVSRRKIYKY